MQVLYSMIYAPDRGGSGAPIYTRHLLDGLAKRGDRAGIIFSAHTSYTNPGGAGYQLIPLLFEHPPIFDNQPKATGSIPFREMKDSEVADYVERFSGGMEKAVSEDGYEIQHVQHGMYIGYAAALIKRSLGIPYVVTLHIMELNFLHEFPDPIMALVAMTEADRIIALTEAQRQRLLNEYSRERILSLHMAQKSHSRNNAEKILRDLSQGKEEIDPSRIVVCPLGIDTALFDIKPVDGLEKEMQQFGVKENDRIVLYSGRLLRMKGVQHLIQAEAVYNPQGNVHTIILGGGELEDHVKQAAAHNRNIHYIGFVEQEEVWRYHNFAASRDGVFSVPSSSEGLSLSYLEAMACGLRVVACCTRDMGDLDFMQEPYACFCQFADSDELARCILKMLEQSNIPRQKIRARMENYNTSNMQKEVYSVYEQVLS